MTRRHKLILCLLMKTWLAGATAGLMCCAAAAEPGIDRDNLTITASTTFRSGRYQINDGDDNGVLHVRGNDLTLDFQGAALAGAATDAQPDEFHGRGIVIEEANNVTLKNLKARGFKVGVYARNCRNLIIENCDFSDNYKQHLLSTPQAENGADWLFGHENDANEWFRYGAAVYLDGCTRFTLRNNIARRGQNGICLVRCNEGAVYDNDCSFNSGWGLALYRSCGNVVARNKFDWCIRGYSHGVYNRGQDSAGILVFEQCSDNAFVFNSATHGGDGFFLFAGLETLDESGQGGCNRNLVYRNDFSHASNNGIEATFSTGNRFIENILDEADHAIWAGYSYGSEFVRNKISRSNHGISIEHGSDNRIEGNTIERTRVGVQLWANASPGFRDKPYGKSHHCRSQEYQIIGNRFVSNQLDVRLANTSQVVVRRNEFRKAPVSFDVAGDCRELTIAENNISGKLRIGEQAGVRFEDNFLDQPPPGISSAKSPLALDFADRGPPPEAATKAPGKQDAFLAKGALRGLEYIFVDEWGPYDFAEIKVMPDRPVFWDDGELRVLGPPTAFSIQDVAGGAVVAPQTGVLPATLNISAPDRKMRQFSFSIALPEKGRTIPVDGLLLFANWDVKFYGWKDAGPQKPPADWKAVLASPVLEERHLSKVDFVWSAGAPSDRVPVDHFATVSTAEIELPAGKYELHTISDDGVRVSVDGRCIIDNWTWHPPAENLAEIELAAGKHALRIEHFEIDGVAQLQFWLAPAKRTVRK